MIEVEKLALEKEKAVLVALINSKQNRAKANEYLGELEFLASTLGIDTLKKYTQELLLPDKRTFIGKGKLEEVKAYVKESEATVIIFDDDLSPSQLRNLENEIKIKVYDRSLLILDIFLYRAQTAQAKTQVELARAQYLLPRLTRMWTHLERQRGGTATRGGAGEKEIETDRRIIRDKITRLKKKLDKIDKQGATRRKGRDRMVRVSLVGYTNVGKSTLMRMMSKSEVFAENKLFATVDSTVRKVVLHNIPFLLTDTVGFIRKLPTTLIECFKSTLDEVRESDILVHVVDISNPAFEDHIEVVNGILTEIGAGTTPQLVVFNKIDLVEDQEDVAFSYLKKDNTVFVSVRDKLNIDTLRNKLFELVAEKYFDIFPNFHSDYYNYYKEYLKDGDLDKDTD